MGGTSGTTEANAINDSGEVVGYSYLPDGNFRGFFWINGKMTPLGTLGGDWSQAYGVNNAGQITGTAYISGNLGAHAFLYSNGVMKDLGTLGSTYSTGTTINTGEVVVGYAEVPSSSEYIVYHAFVYSGSKMQDLTNSFHRIQDGCCHRLTASTTPARSWATERSNGAQHGFLLTPNK